MQNIHNVIIQTFVLKRIGSHILQTLPLAWKTHWCYCEQFQLKRSFFRLVMGTDIPSTSMQISQILDKYNQIYLLDFISDRPTIIRIPLRFCASASLPPMFTTRENLSEFAGSFPLSVSPEQCLHLAHFCRQVLLQGFVAPFFAIVCSEIKSHNWN